MLTRFEVTGFKSLREVSVDLGLVNVFIGANGSGKTNLLEALGVAGAAAFRAVETEALRYRGVRLGLPTLYESSFRGRPEGIALACASDTAAFRIVLQRPPGSASGPWSVAGETLTSRGRELLSRDAAGCRLRADGRDSVLEPSSHETASKAALQQVRNADDARALLDALIDYAIYTPTTPALRGLVADVARSPLGLSGSSLALAVQDLLSEDHFGPFDLDTLWELIDWADDLSVVPAQEADLPAEVPAGRTVLRFRDRFMDHAHNTLSAYDASEGALYVLFLLTLAGHRSAPRLLAVDTFDHALHPRLAARLTREVCTHLVHDGTRQLLLTTHNPLVLDGLDLLDDRIRLFAVERGPGGATQVRRVRVSEALMDEARRGLSLSRLWVMGRLGGVPENL